MFGMFSSSLERITMFANVLKSGRLYSTATTICSASRSGIQTSAGYCQQCRNNSAFIPPSTYPLSSSKVMQRLPPAMVYHSCLFGTAHVNQGIKKSTSVIQDDKPGVLTTMLDKVGLTGKLRFNRFKIRVAGLNMYKSCADGIDFGQFLRACNMRDTLFSWFLVTELHVWMCMARLKQEGREGKYMTHYMVMSMWHDVQERGKVMGISSAKMRDSLSKMVEQFNGALFAYDEGALSSDKVLAAALWRNLFLQRCEDPQQLLDMVAYIREQMQYLDTLDSAKLLQVGRIKWLPFKGGSFQSKEPLPKADSLEDELNIPEFDKVPVV